MSRIEAAVARYRRENLPKLDQLLSWYAGCATLDDAIRAASHGLDHRGRRHPHQRRLKKPALERACADLLARSSVIAAARTFESLYDITAQVAGSIQGLGQLYAYDTALRVGAWLGVYPAAVYLHAGTRLGARAIGVDPSRETVPVTGLPEPFHVLKPHEAEDALCIYKTLLLRQ